MGVSQDTPLAHIFTTSRFCRIADGPDEVHISQLAKLTDTVQSSLKATKAKVETAAKAKVATATSTVPANLNAAVADVPAGDAAGQASPAV